MSAARGIWLVTLRIDAERCTPPSYERIADDSTVDSWLRRVRSVPWSDSTDVRTIVHRESEHLLEDVCIQRGTAVVARYVFDGEYLVAHPAAADAEHLAILHGTLAAKTLDDGVIVLDDGGLQASLRWPAHDEHGVRLTRDGGRRRDR